MTTLSEARTAIYNAFDAVMTLRSEEYFFDNEVASLQSTTWLRLVIRHSDSRQETLGKEDNRKFDRSGFVIVQIFVPLDEGMVDDTLVSAVRNIFEGKTISSIRFYGVNVREIGPDTKWFQINIEAPFNYEETK